MEYVQTVLARIAAARFDEALKPGGLLAELESHRDVVTSQPGSRGMSVTRSLNPEGDVLVVVETRWASNNALADYSTHEPNAASVFNKHKDLLTADGVQVHRMQSDRVSVSEAPARAYDRLMLPLAIPVGVLAFALLVIYGLSRIYLTLPGSWATPLAAGIAIGVLGVSWYFASHPAAPRWQIAGVAVVVLGTLAVAGTGAAVYDDQHAEVKKVESPTAVPAGTPSGAPKIEMADFFFADASGNKNPTISLKVGESVTFDLVNTGTAVHNVHVADASGAYSGDFCTTSGKDPCSNTASVLAGASGKLTIKFDGAGTYDFRCDFHKDQMKGKFRVQ